MTIGQAVQSACVMEVLAPKPGNVSPGKSANFADLTVDHFLLSARAIRLVFESSEGRPLGALIREAVRATRAVVSTNTNLGQILLMAPLAKTFERIGNVSADAVRETLDATTVADAVDCYEAIRQAQPGGLGEKGEQDIDSIPSLPLRQVMAMAADYDDVAAQYAHAFADVFEMKDRLVEEIAACGDWPDAIVRVHVRRLTLGDTLVRRKCGEVVDAELRRLASETTSLIPDSKRFRAALAEFDEWLRADGHRRNPGTTADLVTAALFAGLLEGSISSPDEITEELL